MPTRSKRAPARPAKRRKRPPPRGTVLTRRSRRISPASLQSYHAKRNLAASGEPAGGTGRPTAAEVRRFVVQKHDATRLHYDFRLEMDGVYRSWAVPKGLPTRPGERNLAVEVEDHPLEYGNFEGVIPAGNYGAGTVMLWDRGHYTVSGGAPEQAYRTGKIHLALAGEKSVGEWTLVRMRPRPGERHTNWLIIKNSGPGHRAAISGKSRDQSVLSGRSLDEIANGTKSRRSRFGPVVPIVAARSRRQKTGEKARAGRTRRRTPGEPSGRRVAPAVFVPPMKALSIDEIPAGNWRLEIKFDGYRAIALINRGQVELWSRAHKPLTTQYPEVVEALQTVSCANATIDGEIVALDAEGHSRFQLLQNRGVGTRPAIVYYAFDLLHHDGRSLLDTPIEERQIALEVMLGKRNDALRFSPVFEISPNQLLREVRRQGLEGVIAKTAGSRYEPDRRSGTWLKCKVKGEQEFVIGGFTPPKNSREYFGAILVGYYEAGQLRYAGKVGSGFDRAGLASLHREFARRKVDSCPFADLPQPKKPRFGLGMTRAAMRGVTWIKPQLVAQVQFTEWTDEGSLRHPVFLGLRTDKNPREVVREAQSQAK